MFTAITRAAAGDHTVMLNWHATVSICGSWLKIAADPGAKVASSVSQATYAQGHSRGLPAVFSIRTARKHSILMAWAGL